MFAHVNLIARRPRLRFHDIITALRSVNTNLTLSSLVTVLPLFLLNLIHLIVRGAHFQCSMHVARYEHLKNQRMTVNRPAISPINSLRRCASAVKRCRGFGDGDILVRKVSWFRLYSLLKCRRRRIEVGVQEVSDHGYQPLSSLYHSNMRRAG